MWDREGAGVPCSWQGSAVRGGERPVLLGASGEGFGDRQRDPT